MELRTPSEDVETPETSHDRKSPPRLKSKGEEMVFLEPSEGWGSGGHSYVRTGDPEQEAVRRRTPTAFSSSPPVACPYRSLVEPGPRPPGRVSTHHLCPSDARYRAQPPRGTEQAGEGQRVDWESGVGKW